jgi:hypothetical protein
LTQDQFFDFEREGVIRTKAGDSRVFFFSTRGWSVVESQMYKVFSTGASVMLNEMGVGYGKGVAKEVMLYTKEPKCRFLAGACAGTAGEAFRTRYQATETGCIRAEDPVWEIALRPTA